MNLNEQELLNLIIESMGKNDREFGKYVNRQNLIAQLVNKINSNSQEVTQDELDNYIANSPIRDLLAKFIDRAYAASDVDNVTEALSEEELNVAREALREYSKEAINTTGLPEMRIADPNIGPKVVAEEAQEAKEPELDILPFANNNAKRIAAEEASLAAALAAGNIENLSQEQVNSIKSAPAKSVIQKKKFSFKKTATAVALVAAMLFGGKYLFNTSKANNDIQPTPEPTQETATEEVVEAFNAYEANKDQVVANSVALYNSIIAYLPETNILTADDLYYLQLLLNADQLTPEDWAKIGIDEVTLKDGMLKTIIGARVDKDGNKLLTSGTGEIVRVLADGSTVRVADKDAFYSGALNAISNSYREALKAGDTAAAESIKNNFLNLFYKDADNKVINQKDYDYISSIFTTYNECKDAKTDAELKTILTKYVDTMNSKDVSRNARFISIALENSLIDTLDNVTKLVNANSNSKDAELNKVFEYFDFCKELKVNGTLKYVIGEGAEVSTVKLEDYISHIAYGVDEAISKYGAGTEGKETIAKIKEAISKSTVIQGSKIKKDVVKTTTQNTGAGTYTGAGSYTGSSSYSYSWTEESVQTTTETTVTQTEEEKKNKEEADRQNKETAEKEKELKENRQGGTEAEDGTKSGEETGKTGETDTEVKTDEKTGETEASVDVTIGDTTIEDADKKTEEEIAKELEKGGEDPDAKVYNPDYTDTGKDLAETIDKDAEQVAENNEQHQEEVNKLVEDGWEVVNEETSYTPPVTPPEGAVVYDVVYDESGNVESYTEAVDAAPVVEAAPVAEAAPAEAPAVEEVTGPNEAAVETNDSAEKGLVK